jgi:hypothetical protein
LIFAVEKLPTFVFNVEIMLVDTLSLIVIIEDTFKEDTLDMDTNSVVAINDDRIIVDTL